MYQYIVQFRQVCVATTQINSTIAYFFYHINQQLHLKICNQHELETLFITLIKYLIYETMAFQVLVSTNH